jgi:hypothetical protein
MLMWGGGGGGKGVYFLRIVPKVQELKLNNRYVKLEYFRKVRWM